MVRPRQRPLLPFISDEPASDQRVVLRNVSWDQYVALADSRGESATPRFTYLQGDLEVMSPSFNHERIKKLIARLIEAYDEERAVGMIGCGSTTYRQQAKERGLEPDECYCIGAPKEVPDLAIEVTLTSGGVDKLSVYAGLGVPEAWFWVHGAFHVYVLDPKKGDYEVRDRSAQLPDLDLARVAELVNRAGNRPDHEIVGELRRTLRR